jgi:hypothetical protein
MSQRLAYLRLAKKNPTYQNLATAITTPGHLNTDGTPATGGVPKVISASTRETSATASNANVQRFETLLNDLAKADPRQAVSTASSTAPVSRSVSSAGSFFSSAPTTFSQGNTTSQPTSATSRSTSNVAALFSAEPSAPTQQSTQEPSAFEKDLASIRGASDINAETKQELLDARLEKEVGGGMSRAEHQDFETLLGRLEGSKMKQADQGNRARQREVMTRGLASMMRNF